MFASGQAAVLGLGHHQTTRLPDLRCPSPLPTRPQLPLYRKLELLLLYFGVRKCSTHFVSLGFFCTLVPLTVFTPEVGAHGAAVRAAAAQCLNPQGCCS